MIYHGTNGDHMPPGGLQLDGTVDDDNAELGHEFGLSGCSGSGIPNAYPLGINGLSGPAFWLKGSNKRAVRSQRRFDRKHPGAFAKNAQAAAATDHKWYPIMTDPNIMPVAPDQYGMHGCGSGLPSEYCEGATGSSGALFGLGEEKSTQRRIVEGVLVAALSAAITHKFFKVPLKMSIIASAAGVWMANVVADAAKRDK